MGAIIGEIASDEPLAGAAIGSAIGALTGATVGSGLDEIEARNRSQMVSQAAYSQPIGTTLNEVISMSNAGLSDQIISRHIRNEGFARTLDAGDLIALRQQGVSDSVIADLQDVSSQPAVRVASAEQFIRLYPSNPQVSYAYYVRGVANMEGSSESLKLFKLNQAERDTAYLRIAFANLDRARIVTMFERLQAFKV